MLSTSLATPEAANMSTLRYDYLLDGALRPDGGGIYGAKSTAAYVASVGEPFVTGWSQSQAAAFAIRQGLVVVSDLGPAELTARYLTARTASPTA